MPSPPKLDLSVIEMQAMDDFSICDHLWQLVSDEFYEQEDDEDEGPDCEYPESLFAARLPEPWWVAYGVHAFEYDVLAGGLRQFLDNHRGLTNGKTVEAISAVGSSELAAAFGRMGEAYMTFCGEMFPKGFDEGEDDKADRDLDELFRVSGEEFRSLHQQADLRGKLAAYIKANASSYIT